MYHVFCCDTIFYDICDDMLWYLLSWCLWYNGVFILICDSTVDTQWLNYISIVTPSLFARWFFLNMPDMHGTCDVDSRFLKTMIVIAMDLFEDTNGYNYDHVQFCNAFHCSHRTFKCASAFGERLIWTTAERVKEPPVLWPLKKLVAFQLWNKYRSNKLLEGTFLWEFHFLRTPLGSLINIAPPRNL